MVREGDAETLVVAVLQALAVRGYEPRITPANERRLVRLGALMLDAFDVGAGQTTEENDASR